MGHRVVDPLAVVKACRALRGHGPGPDGAVPPGGLPAYADTPRRTRAAARPHQDSVGGPFAEVRVDVDTRGGRVPRLLGVFRRRSASSSPLSQSQLIGVDYLACPWRCTMRARWTRSSATTHSDLAGFLPTGGARRRQDNSTRLMDDEEEPELGRAGAKGSGESGSWATAAATRRRGLHATGIRGRDLPFRLTSS